MVYLANSHDEVFVVEGSSAASSVKQVCDRQTQYVFAVQGKVPNANKKSRSAIMRDVRVQRLFQYLTLDDTNDSRFGKIILLCDPDIDGQHANYLLASLLRQLRPDWVEKEVVYIAVAPLTSAAVGSVSVSSPEYNVANTPQSVVRYHKGIASLDAELLSQACIDRRSRCLKLLTLAGR